LNGLARSVLLAAFGLAALAALLATPIASGWTLQSFTCDLGGSPDWVATIINLRHLVSFGMLAALAVLGFSDRSAGLPLLLALAVTAAVEFEEAVLAAGHCRLRDLLPDLIAIGLGWAAARLLLRLVRRRATPAV
jgi:hypothetical protein